MNYNDGKWHGWNGGECPVHPETVVDVTTWSDYDFEQNKSSKGVIGINAYRSIAAGKILWRDIIAFRVIKEHKEPREFWVSGGQAFSSNFDAEQDAKMFGFAEIIPVR